MRKKKILLVDTDESVKTMLMDFLKPDYECILAQSSVEGLSYLEENVGEVDLIIIEPDMPAMDGFEMMECIQSNPLNKSIPILIEASPDRQDDIARAFQIGADDVIIKPFHPEIAKRRISNMLEIGDKRRVHNVMEDLIQTEINENIDNLGICPCPICRNDLMTLTLNNVRAKYVSTDKGAIITRAGSMASREERIKLLAEITKYAQLIKGKPRHD